MGSWPATCGGGLEVLSVLCEFVYAISTCKFVGTENAEQVKMKA
jgi:hypothetical protein